MRLGNTIDLIDHPNVKAITLEDDSGALTVFGTNSMIQAILAAAGSGNVLDGISGITEDYFGLFELINISALDPANETQPVPTWIVNPADFADGSPTAEFLESRLVRLNCYTFSQSGQFAVANYDNNGVLVRVPTTAIANSLNAQWGGIPTGLPVSVSGVFGQYNQGTVVDGGYQLLLTSISVPLPGDLNGDGALSLNDYQLLAACMGGPGAPAVNECICADLDGDGDVDLNDFAAFANVH